MAIKFLHDLDVQGNIDLNNNQALNLVVQHLATNPSAEEGKIYYNTSNDVLMVCLGSTWTELSSAVGDITSVVAGTGMTGGGTSGDATLNVIGGNGITASADEILLTNGLIADGANITSVGTIGTGEWRGTPINSAYIGDDQVTEDKLANTLLAEIDANTAKDTNVTTNLGITGDTAARVITSSDGTNVTVPVATTSVSGVMSAAQVTSLNGKANIASPTFTGVPAAPTASANTNTTQVATTAYVQTEISDLIGGAPGALDTLNELAAAIGDDASYATGITTALGLKAPIASPTFTGAATVVDLVIGGHTVSDVDITSEATDADDHLMTALAVKNRIDDIVNARTKSYNLIVAAGTAVSGSVASNSDKTWTITHGMGSSLLYMVQVIQTANGNGETVTTSVKRTTTTVVIDFNVAPTSGDYTVVIVKI